MKKIIVSVILLGVLAIILFSERTETAANTGQAVATEQPQEVQTVRNTDYQIMESDTNEFKNVVYLDVLIHEKLTEEELIEIARKEWVSHGERLYMAVSFHYFSNNNPNYGKASYFVDCDGCEGREKHHEPIEANIFYKGPEFPETINILPAGIDSSKVIARFYDHGWGNNALIAYTNKEKTKASYFHLYKAEKSGEIKLKPLDNMVFKVIDTGAKYQVLNDRVEYIQTNGTISYTYQVVQ
ncbi:hypothetical protein [Dyadobacter sp. LHD-138]|uniref:hypothetical protein n=1 Tax=Dyadobacter sp. LHD-138 TaxID=3071413 RepID=UPI0027DEDDA3|nr:hypothetical protein [Dyadobacter sp. LHD-138]MDQ6481710.1 hypothetical protein [Dyadobacter sp. LHD-138]